jgi:hypothetical protein
MQWQNVDQNSTGFGLKGGVMPAVGSAIDRAATLHSMLAKPETALSPMTGGIGELPN